MPDKVGVTEGPVLEVSDSRAGCAGPTRGSAKTQISNHAAPTRA